MIKMTTPATTPVIKCSQKTDFLIKPPPTASANCDKPPSTAPRSDDSDDPHSTAGSPHPGQTRSTSAHHRESCSVSRKTTIAAPHASPAAHDASSSTDKAPCAPPATSPPSRRKYPPHTTPLRRIPPAPQKKASPTNPCGCDAPSPAPAESRCPHASRTTAHPHND